jgi:hypothetical protein
VVGDASFVARFGRPPSPTDDETLRIQTHLEWVTRALRRNRGQARVRRPVARPLRRFV